MIPLIFSYSKFEKHPNFGRNFDFLRIFSNEKNAYEKKIELNEPIGGIPDQTAKK